MQVGSGRHHESQGAIDNSTRVLSPTEERHDICAQRCYRKHHCENNVVEVLKKLDCMRIEAFRWPARMERSVSCFWRDDGVDGVRDLWEQVRYRVFCFLCVFSSAGGMQDSDPVIFVVRFWGHVSLPQQPWTEDDARCFKDTLQIVNVLSKTLRSTSTDHC